MNYNRRSTRPDGHFYRDSRKIRGAARTRGGIGSKPVAALIVLAVLATIVYVLILR
jgi:hypothetical protein